MASTSRPGMHAEASTSYPLNEGRNAEACYNQIPAGSGFSMLAKSSSGLASQPDAFLLTASSAKKTKHPRRNTKTCLLQTVDGCLACECVKEVSTLKWYVSVAPHHYQATPTLLWNGLTESNFIGGHNMQTAFCFDQPRSARPSDRALESAKAKDLLRARHASAAFRRRRGAFIFFVGIGQRPPGTKRYAANSEMVQAGGSFLLYSLVLAMLGPIPQSFSCSGYAPRTSCRNRGENYGSVQLDLCRDRTEKYRVPADTAVNSGQCQLDRQGLTLNLQLHEGLPWVVPADSA